MIRHLSERQIFLLRITILLFVLAFLVPAELGTFSGSTTRKVEAGGVLSVTHNFIESPAILIGDLSQASLYPSEVLVSNLSPAEILKVEAAINWYVHDKSDDVDVLLEGPKGLRSMLMSDAGGDVRRETLQVAFSMDGAEPIPDSGGISSYEFHQPANYSDFIDGDADTFPPSGPGTVSGEPADLNVFNGTDPNGTWKLYVVDDTMGGTGGIAFGWTLAITVPAIEAVVTTGDDHDDGTCDADCTLREAVSQTNANLVMVALGVGDLLLDDPLVIERPIVFNFIDTQSGERKVLDASGLTSGPAIQVMPGNPVTLSNGEIANSPDGAIGNRGDLTLSNFVIRNNTGFDGAAILNDEGDIELIDTTVRNNHSSFFGVIEVVDGTALLNRVSMFDNSSGVGTLDLFFGNAGVANSTIANNLTKVGEGGGIALSGVSSVRVDSSTIVGNTAATEGGGIFAPAPLRVDLRNSIIAGNSAKNAPDISGTVNSGGFNLIQNTSGTTIEGDTTGNQTGVDPMLGPLQDNGGLTVTFSPKDGSPVIDLGNSLSRVTDQRGEETPFRYSLPKGTCPADCGDIGAVELRSPEVASPARSDFDADGRTDLSVFRFGTWFLNRTTDGFLAFQFGIPGDILVPADVDGDGKDDVGVFRPSNIPGVADFHFLKSSDDTYLGVEFGSPGDVPTIGDYDGDGIADISLWRGGPDSTWYTLHSSSRQMFADQFGVPGDVPVVGDWDGNGRVRPGVFRPSEGAWYLARDTGVPSMNFDWIPFGVSTDVLVPGEYDGDGKIDIAVWRPSNGVWYIRNSGDGSISFIQFGVQGDIPVPGDYDGDGKEEQGIFRNGLWWLRFSGSGNVNVSQFGLAGDIPVPSRRNPR